MRRIITVLLLCGAMGVGTAASAQMTGEVVEESPVNRIGAIEVEEGEQGTLIRMSGSSAPTFSVYRLTKPLRLLVDISNSEVVGESLSKRVGNGVISRAALVGFEENGRSVARLILGFEESAHYDVKADGHDVVVFVDGAKRRSAAGSGAQLEPKAKALGEARAQLSEKEEALSGLRAEREALSFERADALARAEDLEVMLSQTREELDAVADQRDGLAKRLEALSGAMSESRALLDARAEELARAEQRQSEVEAQVERLRGAVASGDESARGELEAAQKKQRETAQALRAQAEELVEAQREAEAGERQVKRLRQLVAKRDAEVGDLRDELDAVRAAQGDERSQIQARLDALRQELTRERERVARLERDRQEAQRALQRVNNLPAARAEALSGDARNAVRDIRLETSDGRTRIVVELDRPSTFETPAWSEGRAVMILNNVTLPEELERTVEANSQGGAVRFLSSYTDADGQVRMEAEVGAGAAEVVRQDGNRVVWEFAPRAVEGSEMAELRGDARPRATKDGTAFTAAPPRYPRAVTDPSKVNSVPGMRRTRLTIDLRSADIQNVLRLLAKEGGVNIITGDGVDGAVTMRLRSVPLDQVFLTILQTQSLGFEVRGNVIRVAPQETLLEEQKARAEARARAEQLQPLEVFLLPVNYAEASDLQAQVEGLLSQRGSVTIDERTNTLIIKDIAENLVSIRALVESLDAQVPQVLIEARIVETNDTFQRQLGIQWGGDVTFAQGNGNPTGLIFPSVLGIGGGATDGQAPTAGTSSTPNFAVNLPAPAGTGAGGAIGLTMGSVGGGVNLNLRLSALEEQGHAKIVSAPKIMTLDNSEATISQGTSIPISVVSAAGVQTVFVDATLELTVTPHVTPDGNIQLQITATKNEPDFQNTGARGDPTIIRKQAETELLIGDGDTTVIGGIYTRNAGSSVSSVPFLHKIPILGHLFKTTSQSERRTELLIFITPRIVNRAESLGAMSAGMSRGAAPMPQER